ncbi:MAG: Do family serine endopeptidase [Gammaproteobacteria bacterium]
MKFVPTLMLMWLAFAPATVAQPGPDFAALVEEASAAVVNIAATRPPPAVERSPGSSTPLEELFRSFPQPFDGPSMGSGFFISDDGYVLTNYHVVHAGSEIVVTLSDRRQLVAEIVGYDEDSDLALLKVDTTGVPVARIGTSERLRVGEWVVAIGSPFGFEHSVTAGIVSAKGRALSSERYVPFLQTDVAINPGNSGGPLFNLQGEVVGINSQIYSRTGGFQGVSFAIPVEVALDVVAQLRAHGRVSRGWLGVTVQDVSRELAESFGLARPEGALITGVLEDSPADRAGLLSYDVILEFDGHPVERSSMLPQLVGGAPANRSVLVRVMRDGRSHLLDVAVGELPREAPLATIPSPGPAGGNRLGAVVAPLTDEQRRVHDLSEHGVLVMEVGGGAARRAGLRVGDVLLSLDKTRIRDVAHFDELVRGLPVDKATAALVQRGGAPLFLAFRVEADE